MNFVASASTDIGLTKSTNQDSFGVKIVSTKLGNIATAILCDGMGGYLDGELASATVVDAFHKWVMNRLPVLCDDKITDTIIKQEWLQIVNDCNEKIQAYGKAKAKSLDIGEYTLGTTATMMMLTPTRYFIMNVGDSRAYEITDKATVLTKDQNVGAQLDKLAEIGQISWEEAKGDPRRNVLLFAVGASDDIRPDMFYGETKKDAVYMLCSDGFRNVITEEEIQKNLSPENMYEIYQMKHNMDTLIELDKLRQESDNITVVSIRTY